MAGGMLLHLARWAPRCTGEPQPSLLASSAPTLFRLLRRRSSVLPSSIWDLKSNPINLDVDSSLHLTFLSSSPASVTSSTSTCLPSSPSSAVPIVSPQPVCRNLASSPSYFPPVLEQAPAPFSTPLLHAEGQIRRSSSSGACSVVPPPTFGRAVSL